MIMKLLEVENLNVSFLVDNEKVHVINDVSFDINENEVLAVIGETGCGKSVMGSAVLRLLPENAVVSGNIYYKNTDILNMPENDFRLMRGKEIASVPQSPSTPSEQFVTLMLTHTRITIRSPYITGLSVTVFENNAISKVFGL